MKFMMALNCQIQYQIDNDTWSDRIGAEVVYDNEGNVDYFSLDEKAEPNVFRIHLEDQSTPFHLIRQDGFWYGLKSDDQVKRFNGTWIDESGFNEPLKTLSELVKSIPIDALYIHQIFKTDKDLIDTIASEKDLYIKFAKKLEQDVIAIIEKFQNRSQQVEALKKYLQTTYDIIQGTGLDYVASPDSVATQAMIEIAKIVAKEEGLSVIEVLMPGVAYEPTGGFKDVVDLRKIDIQEVIITHHFSKKDEKLYLIPVRCLENYIKNPDEKAYYPYFHEALDDYQEFLVDDYESLFNHSKETEELHEKFEEREKLSKSSINLYQQLMKLGEFLKKNDADNAGEELDAGGGAYISAGSFFDYYTELEPCQWMRKDSEPSLDDLDKDVNMAYVYYNQNLYFLNRHNHEEPIQKITKDNQFSRFRMSVVSVDNLPISHPERPLIVKDSQNNFYLFGNDDNPILLTQESILPIYESFPKQANHVIHLDLEGIAPSVFEEIFSKGFHQTSLSTEIDNKFPENKRLSLDELHWIGQQTDHFYTDDYLFVPDEIRVTLNKLRNFLLHPYEFYRIRKSTLDSTIKVETNIATCIGTLGETLRMNIPKLKRELEQIGDIEAIKTEMIKTATENLDQSIELLKIKKFYGRDQNLKFSGKSLEKLFGTFRIADLSLLKRFDLNTLESKHLNLSKINPKNVYNFILDIFELTGEKELKLILPLLENYIQEDSRNDFFTRISDFPPIEWTEFLPKIKIMIPYFISCSNHLAMIYEFVQFHSIDIYELLGEEKILALLSDAHDFLNIYFFLSEEQKINFFEQHEHFLKINLTNEAVINLFRILNPPHKKTFLSQIEIKDFIKNTKDLFQILAYLDNPEFLNVLDECKDFINVAEIDPLVINSEDKDKDKDKAKAICEFLKEKDWPKTLEDYHKLTQELNDQCQKIFLETFRLKLESMITSDPNQMNLTYFLKANPDEKRFEIYMALLEKIPTISEYFFDVLPLIESKEKLNQSQKEALISTFKSKSLITNPYQLFQILGFLENPEFSATLKQFEEMINVNEIQDYLIQNAINSENKAEAICQFLEEKDWPKNLEHYYLVTQQLNEQYEKIFLKTFREKLLALVPPDITKEDLIVFLNTFPDAERFEIYMALLEKIPTLSQYFDDVMIVFKKPDDFQAFEQNYNALPQGLENSYFRFYDQSQQLDNMIQNEHDLESYMSMGLKKYYYFQYWSFLDYLIKKSEISIELLSSASKKITPTIKAEYFLETLKNLPNERMKSFYQHFKNDVDIHSEEDFYRFIFSSIIDHLGMTDPTLINCISIFLQSDKEYIFSQLYVKDVNRTTIDDNIEAYIRSKSWQLDKIKVFFQDRNELEKDYWDGFKGKSSNDIYTYLKTSKLDRSFQYHRLCVFFANSLASVSDQELMSESESNKTLVYVALAQRYIQKLERDLSPYRYGIKKKDDFYELTQRKLDIMRESLNILTQEEKGIEDVKAYLETEKVTLSKHRDRFLQNYCHRYLRDGLYFMYDCVTWMFGYSPTAGMKLRSFFEEKTKRDEPDSNQPKKTN